MQRIMILPSEDGQDYVMAVLLAPSADADLVAARIASELDVCKTLVGVEWNWNDLAKALQTIPGVTVTEIVRGPVWDSN